MGHLKEEIRHTFAGSYPSEAYDIDLIDDPSFRDKSVLVPDDIKQAIVTWTRAMGLSASKKKTRQRQRRNT